MKFFSLAKRFWVRSYGFFAACLNITNNQDFFVILVLLNIRNFAIQINRGWSTIVMPIRNALHCFIYKYRNSINSLTICQTGCSSLQIKALTKDQQFQEELMLTSTSTMQFFTAFPPILHPVCSQCSLGKKEPRTAVFRQSSQTANAGSLYPALFLLHAFTCLWLRVFVQTTHQPKKQIY